MSRALVLAASDPFAARVHAQPGTQVVVLTAEAIAAERFDLLRSLDPQQLPDLVFLGEDMPVEQVAELASAIDRTYPSIDLIMVGAPPAEVVMEAMRAGVRDIVAADCPDDRLVEVVRRAEARRPVVAAPVVPAKQPSIIAADVPGACHVVTVVSPKGGVGKTSIATNLAIGLAEQHPMEVVLVDLDLQFGDVASVLDLAPTSTMADALGPAAVADTLVLKTHLTVHPTGQFHVLAGSESPAATEDAKGADISRLLEQLGSQFAYVVVDTASGLDEPTLAALERTDHAVIVSTMDVSCVRSVRKEVELLQELQLLPLSRTLTLNLADKQSGMRVKDVEAVIGLPVDLVIPRSSDVQLAANHGTPLMLKGRKRGGPFVKAIGSMVERLERQRQGRNLTDTKHRRLDVA